MEAQSAMRPPAPVPRLERKHCNIHIRKYSTTDAHDIEITRSPGLIVDVNPSSSPPLSI